jgi:NAD(P)-dependent dehydrogenase (short-subunit alcohol dehydrogenase family)
LRQLAEDSGERLQILVMDVTDPGSVKAAAAELDGQAIDLLLNNSGIIGPQGQTIGNIDYDAWAKVLDVNTNGTYASCRGVCRACGTQRSQAHCHTDERNGIDRRQYLWGSILYRSSKAAVNMVMRSLAIDLASRGITCVVVNPGWVQTDMGGANTTLTPAESVTALRRLIETLGPAQSGKFFNYDGREYAW